MTSTTASIQRHGIPSSSGESNESLRTRRSFVSIEYSDGSKVVVLRSPRPMSCLNPASPARSPSPLLPPSRPDSDPPNGGPRGRRHGRPISMPAQPSDHSRSAHTPRPNHRIAPGSVSARQSGRERLHTHAEIRAPGHRSHNAALRLSGPRPMHPVIRPVEDDSEATDRDGEGQGNQHKSRSNSQERRRRFRQLARNLPSETSSRAIRSSSSKYSSTPQHEGSSNHHNSSLQSNRSQHDLDADNAPIVPRLYTPDCNRRRSVRNPVAGARNDVHSLDFEETARYSIEAVIGRHMSPISGPREHGDEEVHEETIRLKVREIHSKPVYSYTANARSHSRTGTRSARGREDNRDITGPRIVDDETASADYRYTGSGSILRSLRRCFRFSCGVFGRGRDDRMDEGGLRSRSRNRRTPSH
ncbi:hypothetical protein F4777DRAFT_584239 [Nemania sp. FL0916]|nr:hypothetical protein F4777DRAFT_584239 [Nemania sp. FL0916]